MIMDLLDSTSQQILNSNQIQLINNKGFSHYVAESFCFLDT